MKNNKLQKNLMKISSLFLFLGANLLFAGCTNQNNEDLFFTIKNNKDLEVTFCDRGASIYSIKFKNQYVTYHPKNKSDFLKDNYYYGKALGRVAGRIKDGKLKVAGKDYQLEVNETSGSKHNSLHGGTNSLTAKNFKRYVEETDDAYKVSFNYVSPSLEAGYPELLDTWYTYVLLKNSNTMEINITAHSSGTTPVNLSNHPYFRLGNEGDVLSHVLEVPSTQLALYDETAKDQTVIGIKNIENTPWDFRNGKAIGKDIQKAKELDQVSGGYDHIWKFDSTSIINNYVKLTNPTSKISLTVASDANAVIMYANCYPNENLEMNPSGKDALYSGITIEPISFFTKDTIDDLNITPENSFSREIFYSFQTI